MNIATLTIEMAANVVRLQTDMNSASKIVSRTMRDINKQIDAVKSAFGALGVGLSGAAFVGFIKRGIDAQDALVDLSQKTGMTVEQLAGMKFALSQTSTSVEEFSTANKKLSANLTANPRLFQQLGITAKDSMGVMLQLSSLFSSMPDGVTKTALAVKLMGKSGEEMIPFLNQGADAMGALIARGQEINPVTTENALRAKAFNDTMDELGTKVGAVGISIGNRLLPLLQEMASELSNTTNKSTGLSTSFDPLSETLKAIIILGGNFVYTWERIGNEIGARGAQIAALAHGDFDAVRNINKMLSDDNAKALKDFEQWQARILALKQGTSAPAAAPLSSAPKPTMSPQRQAQIAALLKGPQPNGSGIISSLTTDYANQYSKLQHDQNSPTMSATDKQYADNLAAVTQRAGKAREEIGKLKLTEAERVPLLAKVNAAERAQIAGMAQLKQQVDANNASWQYGARVALTAYLDEVQNVAASMQNLFTSAFKGMEDALLNFVRSSKLDFSSLANSIINDLLRIQIQQSITGPLAMLMGAHLGGKPGLSLDGGMPAARGAWFDNGAAHFANGGVVTSPTMFRFASGGGFRNGIMGEAGAEAIMPLKRGANGKLGVSGGGGITIHDNSVYHIDSRTDRAQIQQDMRNIAQQKNAELVDKLQRQRML